MIDKLLKTLYYFKNKDHIPKTPRMYKTEYDEDTVTEDEWRVLSRLGSRDTTGIKLAMKQYGVKTLDELVKLLEHHKPQRRVRDRFYRAMQRALGKSQDHTKRDWDEAFRKRRNQAMLDTVRERVLAHKEMYRDE